MKIVQDAGAVSRARSKFPDPIWSLLTNLLVIRFTHTHKNAHMYNTIQSCEAITPKEEESPPSLETFMETISSAKWQKNMTNKDNKATIETIMDQTEARRNDLDAFPPHQKNSPRSSHPSCTAETDPGSRWQRVCWRSRTPSPLQSSHCIASPAVERRDTFRGDKWRCHTVLCIFGAVTTH